MNITSLLDATLGGFIDRHAQPTQSPYPVDVRPMSSQEPWNVDMRSLHEATSPEPRLEVVK